MRWIQTAIMFTLLVGVAMAEVKELSYTITPVKGLGPEKGVMRQDPSDIIKVRNLYYV